MKERDTKMGRDATRVAQSRPRFRSKLLARLLADADDLEPFLRVRTEARGTSGAPSPTIGLAGGIAEDDQRIIADLDRMLDEVGRELGHVSLASSADPSAWRDERRVR